MSALRILCRYRSFLNDSLFINIKTPLKLTKRLKQASHPTPVLVPDDSFELGDFNKDLRRYLKNPKSRKNYTIDLKEDRNEIPIIVCKNKKLNHFRNQTYDQFKPIPLASEHWTSHKSTGDYFYIKIHTSDYEVKSRKQPVRVDDCDLRPEIKDIIKSQGFENLSEIQGLAISPIFSGKNVLLGAETGTGKTLAYLLPVIQQILEWKKKEDNVLFNSPYVFIVAPSRELVDQIRDFCEWFKKLGIKTRRILGGSVHKKISNPAFGEVDILISTPGIAMKLSDADIYSFRNVRHVILDEADCLLDDSFNELTRTLLQKFSFRNAPSLEVNSGVQLTMVSATMPTSLSELLEEIIDVELLERVVTDRVNYLMPHIMHKFIRTGKTSKPSYFLDIAKKDFKKQAPAIYFCNQSETCTWLGNFLEDNNIPNIVLHGDINLRERKGKFADFQKGICNALVCTSLASRGLDTARVQHVVNYEFPSFIVEYIHRCGRTGRLSSKKPGIVTSLISGRNEVGIVQKIEKTIRTSSELDNVNPNIRRMIKYHNATEFEKKFGLLS